MKRLGCPTCGNEVYFGSLECVRCDTELVVGLEPHGQLAVLDAAETGTCANRRIWGCNWRSAGGACASCALVDAGSHADDAAMIPFQHAQRRVLYQLTELSVPWPGPAPAGGSLRFAYRSKRAGDGALIGHRGGEITLDLDEADPVQREQIRATLGEHYRTPLGHLRHELGHYVWLTQVVTDAERLDRFRALFGDERADYSTALEQHYARIDDGSWRSAHASFYASSHPWEDFAESWAQLMHIHDVVETGAAWGVVQAPRDRTDAQAWLSTSITVSLAANELARSMGVRDLYPFALSKGVLTKVGFCWGLVYVTPPT